MARVMVALKPAGAWVGPHGWRFWAAPAPRSFAYLHPTFWGSDRRRLSLLPALSHQCCFSDLSMNNTLFLWTVFLRTLLVHCNVSPHIKMRRKWSVFYYHIQSINNQKSTSALVAKWGSQTSNRDEDLTWNAEFSVFCPLHESLRLSGSVFTHFRIWEQIGDGGWRAE